MSQGSTPILLTIHGKRLGIGYPQVGGVDGSNPLILDGNIIASPNPTDLEVHGSISLAQSLSATTPGGKILNSTSSAITALAGGGYSSLTPVLNDSYNLIAVCATTSDSVQLPVAALTSTLGTQITVKNEGAATGAIFPLLATTDIINALTTGVAIPLATVKTMTFTAEAVGKWGTRCSATS